MDQECHLGRAGAMDARMLGAESPLPLVLWVNAAAEQGGDPQVG
jgi:hypothetical protein